MFIHISVIFIPLVCVTFTTENEHLFTSKGWIPISKEDVLNINSEYHKRNNEYMRQNAWDHRTSDTEQNMQLLKDNAIKVVIPAIYQIKQEIISESNTINNSPDKTTYENNSEHTSINCKDGPSCNSNNFKKYVSSHNTNEAKIETDMAIELTENRVRTSKAIKMQNIKDPRNNTLSKTHNSVYNENKTNASNTMHTSKVALNEDENKQESQIYEVIENFENFETKNMDSERPIDSAGYFYKPPQIDKYNNLEQNNITNAFFDILNKYNIRPQDHSPNYDLSRLNKGRNMIKQSYTHVPIPLRIPNRYNSQNHLPIDPLIAVFLSNYGYYIPGMYGHKSNYRNLYGYLASNNIHNNLPFGFYKIFADTDSSN